MNILKKNYPRIYKDIIRITPNKNIYQLIETRTNNYTLRISLNSKTIFLHSKYDPQREAVNIAQDNFNPDIDNYIVFGLGFGYHVKELIKLAPNSNFYIIETNKDIFRIALENVDLTNIIDNKRIKLYLSDNVAQINEVFKKLSILDNMKVIIHGPSLNAMSENLISVKHLLEEFKVKEASIKQYSDILEANFKENIKNYDANVDILFNRFDNIPLYIVSAGPSLDKNIDQLSKINGKGIILVVGRAVKALYKANIRPDFIIVTDPKPSIYRGQLKGVDTDVPIIVLSTCDKNVMLRYKGKKFMALQKDFHLAENYAKEHENDLVDTGGSVATTALDVAINMGCNPIVFIGQDLAFTEQRTHTSLTSSGNINHLKNLREVEDIRGNMVHTSKNLSIYLRWIENRIVREKNITFIDATEGGARIKGAQVLTLGETIEKYSNKNVF